MKLDYQEPKSKYYFNIMELNIANGRDQAAIDIAEGHIQRL
jgi:hypothetical protein